LEPLLRVRNLRVWFDVRMGLIAGTLGKKTKHVRAVDGVSFDVKRGEIFCLVGESGCGKTTTGKALLRLNAPTGGNIFFDLPDDGWNRLGAFEARLAALYPHASALSPGEIRKAYADWARVQGLTNQVESTRHPRGSAGRVVRRERYEKTIAFLNEREQGLRDGADAMIKRLTSKERNKLEVAQTLGPWFKPTRVRKLHRLEEELEEARYQLTRSESLHTRTGTNKRKVRRLERRLEAMRKHAGTTDPTVPNRTEELRRELAEKEKHLTEQELGRVREEQKQVRDLLDQLTNQRSSVSEQEIGSLNTAIASVRSQGGPGLEAWETRAAIDEIRDRYDLATWGAKGTALVGIRPGRRKRLRRRMRGLRRRMQIIYQDPYESLNPKLSIYDIVAEPLLANRIVSTQSEAEAVVAKALEDVGLRPASEYMLRYPHELSGGQRQRVGIATALVVDPDFIVADEPVSMLDASVRTEILALLLELKKQRDLTYLFITHDLGLAWILADRVAVMYLGKIVETGDGPEIIRNPRHPYTKALISVVPSPNPSVQREKIILHGERPNPVDIPGGCRFHPRCPMAVGVCGWNSEEVQEELKKLLNEDREQFPESARITNVETNGPLGLTLTTSDPAQVEKYLWKRLQAVGLGRPALGAIRRANIQAGRLELILHEAVEPPLLQITGNVSVACHLVEPESVIQQAVGVGA